MIAIMYHMRALDHRVLRQFLAVADAGTVRSAAQSLNMSQPPLSTAIRQLEARLGTELFERSASGMEMTKAGRILAQEARALLGQLNRAEQRVSAMGQASRPFRIGFVSAALNDVLPSILNEIRRQDLPVPGLWEMTTPEQLRAFEEAQLDIGLMHPPIPRIQGLSSVSLGRDSFCAALPADHPLAVKSDLSVADVADEALVLFPPEQGRNLFETIRSLFCPSGGALNLAAGARRIHTQLALVAGGLGIGLITESTARTLTFKGVVTRPIPEIRDKLFIELVVVAEASVLAQLKLSEALV